MKFVGVLVIFSKFVIVFLTYGRRCFRGKVEAAYVRRPLPVEDEGVAAEPLIGGDGEVRACVEVDEVEHVDDRL